MTWRYQPVWLTVASGVRAYSLCECGFDDVGALKDWTEEPTMIPQGETALDLQRDLVRMLKDAWKWEPVDFEMLHVGMVFERTGVDIEDVLGAMNRAIELGRKEP